MKKIVALALCLVMVLGLMSGCQKSMDLTTLTRKMDEAAKNVTATGMNAGLEMEMNMSVMGMTMTMGMDMEMDLRSKADNSAEYMDVKMAVDAMGESEETNMEVYGVMEDGALVTYTYEKNSGIWLRSNQDGYGDMASQFTGMQSFTQMPFEQMMLAEEKVTVSDRACYLVTVNMEGEQMQTYMSDYMGTLMSQLVGGGEMTGEELEMVGEMDWTGMYATLTYHVDAETFLPLEMTMEIHGLGRVLNDLLVSLMLGMDSGDLDFSIDVPAVKVTVKNMIYNEVVEFPGLPLEAIDNALTEEDLLDMGEEGGEEEEYVMGNPPQEDGSFLMPLNGTTFRIAVPEGYFAYMSEPNFLCVMSDDYTLDISYMTQEYYTLEQAKTEFADLMQILKDEGRWESDEIIEDVNGFTVAKLATNDGVFEINAWMEIGGGMLNVYAYSSEQMPVLDEVLANITIVE